MRPAAAASRMPKGSMAYVVKMTKMKKDTWGGGEGGGESVGSCRLTLLCRSLPVS